MWYVENVPMSQHSQLQVYPIGESYASQGSVPQSLTADTSPGYEVKTELKLEMDKDISISARMFMFKR